MAIIETGGKQYRVSPDSVIEVEKLAGDEGDELILDRVLMVDEDGETQFGNPLVEGARVVAEVIAQKKAGKILVYKFKRRKGYHRTQGHRQCITKLKIKKIELKKAPKARKVK